MYIYNNGFAVIGIACFRCSTASNSKATGIYGKRKADNEGDEIFMFCLLLFVVVVVVDSRYCCRLLYLFVLLLLLLLPLLLLPLLPLLLQA